jgi:hypothetical protein
MGFDFGQGLPSQIGASANVLGAATNGFGAATNLAGQLKSAFSADDVGSAIRAIDLPAAGEAIGDIVSAVSSFGGDANSNDWRVRLSLANWSSFKSSPVLGPLKDAGGLIFPYTPQITMNSSAKYSQIPTTHTNYAFQAYQNSDPGTIQIIAPMNVEDPTQGLYWIAAVHYLRSLTKMFAGSDPKAGNPPPIVMLNGYGNYVFKNVPVVVTGFSTTLDAGCDYIGVNVVGSAAGGVEGVADSIGGLSSTVGSLFGGGGDGSSNLLGDITGGISAIAGGVGQVAGLLGTFGVGGSVSGGVAHVPTKSSFTVTLQPIYSRSSVRNFSLDRFVTGGYLNNSFGYI